MNVYVETNFVLELALAQEQQTSCEEILALAEAGRVRLLIPAYSLIEPYEALRRRHQDRARVKNDLDRELSQLKRTAAYAIRVDGFQEARALLADSTDEETKRLEGVRSRLLNGAEVIPLGPNVMKEQQSGVGLSPQDAIVLRSVLSHLERTAPSRSCFPNRNWRDFDNPFIVEKLGQHGCKLLPSFDDGCQYVRHVLSSRTS